MSLANYWAARMVEQLEIPMEHCWDEQKAAWWEFQSADLTVAWRDTMTAQSLVSLMEQH